MSPDISERAFEEAIECGLLQHGPDACAGDADTVREDSPPFGDTPPGRTPTFGGALVLDHVFVDLPEGWDAATRVVGDTYRSDHHPVIATITVEDEPLSAGAYSAVHFHGTLRR